MTVWVADRSQVTRLGIISVVKQLEYQLIIRELPSFGRWRDPSQKTSSNLLIISSSFLSSWEGNATDRLEMLMAFPARVLIWDLEIPDSLLGIFDEVIHPDDAEKTILRKINLQISFMLEKAGSHPENSEISDREKDVLRLVAMGLTNKEIAEKLYISTHTVITHRKNITAKLGIKTIAGLSVYAVINKLISIDDIQ